jgi:hypothetical protein
MNIPRKTSTKAKRFLAAALAALFVSFAPSSFSANILYLVNTVVDPTTPANAHDGEVLAHLTGLGHTVTLADDTTVTLEDLTGQDLVLISSSTGSGEAGMQNIINNSLRTGRMPVISYEPGVYDELGLQTATTFGNAAGHTTLGIVTASHPTAAGKTGVIQITEPDTTATLSYTPAPPYTLGTDAIIIATNASVDVGRIAMWAHERGSRLANNSTVTAGRKVALFFNASTGLGVYNTNAYALFDAALTWALEPAPVLPIIAQIKAPSPVNAIPNSPIVIELEDGTAAVNASTIALSINGTPVSSPTITENGAITRIEHQPAALFPSGSSNIVRIVYSDNATPSKTFTNEFQFRVATYGTLPTGIAYPTASADASAPGFRARVVQANTGSGTLANTAARAEAQLAGTLIDPATGSPFVNEANTAGAGPDGFFVDADVINWNQNALGVGAESGSFRGPTFPDEPIPGIPGTDGVNTDNVAAEILTFLELKAGAHTLGVNSDDGFEVTTGVDGRDAFATTLGSFEGGRGAADTTFSFVAPVDGLYPFRVLWYEGNGDSSVEFFSVDPTTGEKILVNDRTNPKAIKAWRQITTATRPFVSAVGPTPGSLGVPATSALEFTFVNGGASVNTNTVQIRLNGQLVPITSAVASGNSVQIAADPAGDLAAFTPYTVQLIYSDTANPANTVTNEFSFTTIRKPIQQDALGLAVVEAEHFSVNTPQGQHAWIPAASPAGFSGEGTMYASPDAAAATINFPAVFTTSPRLDFQINFVKTGTHYFWFRGSDGGGDSLHAGIDDIDPTGTNLENMDEPDCCGDRLVPSGTSFRWINGTTLLPDGRATFEVTEPGIHTIHLWMREDGQIVDKILVTTNETFTPTGTGPAESPRVGDPLPPTIAMTSPTANQQFAAGSPVTITVDASDTDGAISKVEFFEGANKIGEDTTAPFSFEFRPTQERPYTLTAKATDNSGLTATSGPVRIIFGNVPTILFISSANPMTDAGDIAVVNRLESQGFLVEVVDDNVSDTAQADGKALVVISSTVGSGNVAAKFADVAVPVINWEEAIFDDMRMTGDSGAAPDHHGSTGNLTQIDILNASHPLAAGLSGTVTVTSSPQTMSWGVSDANPTNAIVIAQVAGDPTKWAIWAYDKGGILFDGTAAAERRVGFFFNAASVTATTADGFKLFDAAVNWALRRDVELAPQMSISKTGDQISISWTNGGVLEWTSALTPGATWTPLPNAPNPYTEPATQTMRFFRVRK